MKLIQLIARYLYLLSVNMFLYLGQLLFTYS